MWHQPQSLIRWLALGAGAVARATPWVSLGTLGLAGPHEPRQLCSERSASPASRRSCSQDRPPLTGLTESALKQRCEPPPSSSDPWSEPNAAAH
jgi:hypothetical protein